MVDCRICVQDCSVREDVWDALKENCRNYKPNPITNADRLRAMSDEELAGLVTDDMCELLCGAPLVCEGQCKQKMLDWLRQEAADA